MAPKIHDLDRAHRFEPAFLKGMADLHLLGICIPEELGGAGMDYISLGLASEELEYVDTHLRVIMSVHVGLNCMTLMCWGSEHQKKKYLLPQAKGARSHKVSRCLETPGRYVLQIEWDTLEDHMVGFRESAAFTEWRALLGPHFASPPAVEHYKAPI